MAFRRVRLTGRATRFVGLLKDFGHLDERTTTDFLVALADAPAGAGRGRLDLPEVRRFAASYLYGADGDPSALPHLDEDWPILFS